MDNNGVLVFEEDKFGEKYLDAEGSINLIAASLKEAEEKGQSSLHKNILNMMHRMVDSASSLDDRVRFYINRIRVDAEDIDVTEAKVGALSPISFYIGCRLSGIDDATHEARVCLHQYTLKVETLMELNQALLEGGRADGDADSQ